jgi:hypothetical protein
VNDPSSLLRTATRRAKSDVANKLVSMFLHELSKSIVRTWEFRVDSEQYGALVRDHFGNRCPYCLCDLNLFAAIVEHLDGMNRYRAGLHVPGNVLVACKRCNSEKRRDDSLKNLVLAETGWASFLSHDGSRCPAKCNTCRYWAERWDDETERKHILCQNFERIESFRAIFADFQQVLPTLTETLPTLLAKLYIDCQVFAETEIRLLLDGLISASSARH